MDHKHIHELIAGCKNNDRQCQEEVYKYYYPNMRQMLYKYFKDIRDLDEVINDGFLKVFKKIDSYQGIGSFEGWVRVVIKNTALNTIKSPKHKDITNDRVVLAEIKNMWRSVAYNDNGEYEAAKQFEIAISLLPKSSEKVMRLASIGYKYREIADMLNTAEGTIKWHVAKSRQKLSFLLS